MASIRLAVLYSSLGRYILMAIGLVSAMIVARLLTPSEIGTFAIASSIVMIMAEFRILGANTYVVREPELTDDKIRSAYGLTILISWALGLLVVLAANPLSNYYNLKEIALIFYILSVSFLLAPYISIPDAILAREYRFKEIAVVRTAAAASQLIFTVLLIYRDFSYYALAIGHLVSVFVQVSLAIYYTRHVKVYLPIFRNLKPIAKLGIYTSISHVIRKSQQTVPDLIIGKMGSTVQVGLFSRGLGFMVFVSDTLLSGVTPVALPYLTDVRKKGENILDAYTIASQLITGVVWPVLAVASIASLPVIRLMFGDQWDQAAPIASIVALWAIMRAGHILAPNALIAMGYEASMLIKEIIAFLIFLVLVIYFYKSFGLIGAAYAFAFAGAVDFVVSSCFMKIKVGLGFLSYCYKLVSSALVALICAATTFAISVTFPFGTTSSIVSFLQICAILPPVWVAALFLVKHPLRLEVIRFYQSYIK